ncbi:MAG: hypothetical protein M3151_15365 [Actinomycetota bacterium]|nr:hypothetical protein [Actinomycetota bacterium]
MPKLTVTSLAIALALSTPAFAQGNDAPADSQYDDVGIESVEDIPGTLADSAAHGTGSMNEALEDPAPPGNEASASEEESSFSEADKVAGMTVLPETGGALPAVPCSGALLVAAGGLLMHRSLRR